MQRLLRGGAISSLAVGAASLWRAHAGDQLVEVPVVGGHSGMVTSVAAPHILYKPAQAGKRGTAERNFYVHTCSPPPKPHGYVLGSGDAPEAREPCRFMPAFYGVVTQTREVPRHAHALPTAGHSHATSAAHGSAHGDTLHVEQPFLALENLTHGYAAPCVMDIKMGVQTWDEDASPDKVAQEIVKFPPQRSIGWRFTG
ncbi:hypothetical protein EON62_01480, partial [archaeon]